MRRWHEQYLGLKQIPTTLSAVEIEHYFTLSPSEMAIVGTRRRPLNRLGVALQIGFLRMTVSIRSRPQGCSLCGLVGQEFDEWGL